MPDRLAAAASALSLADRAADLALRVVGGLGLSSPASRAARLRGRALRLRARADAICPQVPEVYISRRERLRARARALELRADALWPALPAELPPERPRG